MVLGLFRFCKWKEDFEYVIGLIEGCD